MFDNFKAKLAGAWKSWTIWFNGAIAAFVAALPAIQSAFPEFMTFMPSSVRWVIFAIVAANVALRFKTVTSLAQK